MIEVPLKYAFPLFTKINSTDYLIKHDEIRVSDLWAFWHYIIGRCVNSKHSVKSGTKTIFA